MAIHLFLDWSGTLWDDLSTTLAATNRVLCAHGGQAITADQYRRDFQIPVLPFYQAHIPAGQCPSVEVLDADFARLYTPETGSKLYPGVERFLRTARQAGGQCHIVSSLPQELLLANLAQTGVHDQFTGIHGGIRNKVEFLPGLLESLGLSPDDCLMLGDTVHDLEAARQARVRACSIGHGYTHEDVLRSHHPDEFWTSVHQAADWLERHLSLERNHWPIATVGGLVFNEQAQACFVRTAKWSNLWGTPGGKIDYNEGHLEAFVREMREETGLETNAPKMVLVQDALEEPEFHKPRHFVLLNLIGKTSGQSIRLNHESTEGGWFTLEQAQSLALNRPTRVLVEYLLAQRAQFLEYF